MTTWFVNSGAAGTDTGADWTNAAASVTGLMTAQVIAAGDIIKVHKTHSFLAGGGITWTLPESGAGEVMVICVDKDAGDALSTGALESTNGNFAFTLQTATTNGALYIHGMSLQSGAGASSSSADINIVGFGEFTFSACSLWIDSTNVGALLALGSSAGGAPKRIAFHNCNFRFSAVGNGITIDGAHCDFYNCVINSSGSSPTTLFLFPASSKGSVQCHSCDWSLATNVVNQALAGGVYFLASNCVIGTPVTGTHPGFGGLISEFMACAAVDGTNGADILSYYKESNFGVVEDDQAVFLTTGGAQGEQDDGTDTPYSFKLTPSTVADKDHPLYTPWVYQLVGSTGDKTVTLKCAHTEAAVLTTSQIFMEVEYMGEPGATGTQRVANSPHSQLEVDDDCNIMTDTLNRDVLAAGSNRTDTAVAWTGITSEKTHTLTASVNCAEVGYIRCRVGLAKDTTNPVYVDPKIGVA